METSESGLSAIALYVPDATVRAMSEAGMFERAILDGVPELDFLPTPWWEDSHTVKLGLMQHGTTDVRAEECETLKA